MTSDSPQPPQPAKDTLPARPLPQTLTLSHDWGRLLGAPVGRPRTPRGEETAGEETAAASVAEEVE